MSHTVRVKIEIRDMEALAAAVADLGGRVLGKGEHRLYQGPVRGLGIQLPGWSYPVVLESSGQIAYDDYHGHWGDVRDLDRLRERYAIRAAEAAAVRLGWYAEVDETGVTIFHPDGGTLRVDASGRVSAHGITGSSCVEASAPIEEGLGRADERVLAPEYYDARAVVRVVEREG